jgi:hypothetical protein
MQFISFIRSIQFNSTQPIQRMQAEPKKFGNTFMTGPVLAGLVDAYVQVGGGNTVVCIQPVAVFRLYFDLEHSSTHSVDF